MAQNIRNKRLDDIAAPTPQNTPASVSAPIGSLSKAPGVPTISEEAQVSMIQGKLGSLVGRSSGYVESLPPAVRRRILGLKGIQEKHAKLEAEFQAEILELEKKFLEKYKPLYETRAKVVAGKEEATDEDVAVGKEVTEDDEEEEEEEEEEEQTEAAKVKGIPEFWLTAMRNVLSLAEIITPADEAALGHLVDIRMSYLDTPGFKLEFEFEENEFFTNKVLTKTYYYQEEAGYGGDFIYDRAEGDKIEWKEDKDLTVRVETKKQRNKNTNQTRIVKKTVPQDSFFSFFSPPTVPDYEDDEAADAASDIDERLELDYQIGEDIKEKLIPRAVDWFTGEALAFEGEDDLEGDEFDDEDDFEDDDSEEEDEDDDEDDEEVGAGKKDQAECKQSVSVLDLLVVSFSLLLLLLVWSLRVCLRSELIIIYGINRLAARCRAH
ncbi:hypothetical protein G7K_6890-t1 [Saitoella complicata NRRL Y-17804]|uniref:Nucleosome assembly protein n=2 Tax=Saitoella complicata (strain BCRC 22490 / CBS 7301 / JCM 7358 / NBRC 10748 / NRRL Y-17804) TaxID=698492 RepID=A0A0E9NSS8_SAICN|nr:hypothetical protein G7K_6890-t1 [Saitoella complicata NRRL Y-17804]